MRGTYLTWDFMSTLGDPGYLLDRTHSLECIPFICNFPNLNYSCCEAMNAITSEAKSSRSVSIDCLRGAVMIVMALDHSRDFFTSTASHPVFSDLTNAQFVTRWITHICAPTFVFLAGTGARLSLNSSGSKSKLRHFLLSRGIWLIFLEGTLVNWNFSFQYASYGLGILWALAWSMIFLAGLTFLNDQMVTLIGIIIVLAHNIFDGVQADHLGSLSWLWKVLHEPGTLFSFGSHSVKVSYPLVPWIGLMAVGYGFGGLWNKLQARRVGFCVKAGFALLLGFVCLRAINEYGDPSPWTYQGSAFRTILSFLNFQKYPPSLDYILGTIGLSFLFLALFEKFPSLRLSPFNVFGKVPMLYYIIHLYFLHLASALYLKLTASSLSSCDLFNCSPLSSFGYSLPLVYSAWIAAVFSLYPVCLWYAGIKGRSKAWWLKFL
jgi:uncharacterized membrane protein